MNSDCLYRLWLRKDIKAARAAIKRYYGVTYMTDINQQELRGMVELERRGEVIRCNKSVAGIHWHVAQYFRHYEQ